jgi:hypothetical protein
VDVSVYEHEIFAFSLLHETTNRNITGAVNKRFILGGIQIQLDTLPDEEKLEFDDT